MTGRIPLLTTMAIACAVLVLAITTLSAFIRLARPASACEPWPQCQSALAPRPAGASAPSAAVAAARVAHRIAASAALLLIIGMLMVSYASQPVLREPGRLVLALLGLALFLAVLGRMGADSRASAVVLGNLLAGFALFAVSARLAALLVVRGGRAAPWAPRWTWVAVALLGAQIALGAVASTTSDNAALPHLIHQIASIVLAAVLLALGWLAWRRGRAAGALVVVLVLLELAGGGLLLAWPQSLGLALAHNVVAALLLAAVAGLAGRTGG